MAARLKEVYSSEVAPCIDEEVRIRFCYANPKA